MPEETARFVEQATAGDDLKVTAIEYFPFITKVVTLGELPRMIRATQSPYRRFAFTLAEPVLPAKHELDFGDKNPDHLRLDVGTLCGSRLEQSWLTARTTDPHALAVWRGIANKLKKLTRSGVTAIDPKTGASSIVKSFRYTEGVKAFVDSGGEIQPPAGTTVLRLV